jgi:hypothetical protein
MCCFTRDCNLFSFRPEGGTSYNGDGVPTVHTPCARHTLLCCSASRRCRVQKSCGRVRRRTAAGSLLALLGWCWTNERRFRNGLCFDGTCTLCCQGVESVDHLAVQCVFSRRFGSEFFIASASKGRLLQSRTSSQPGGPEYTSKYLGAVARLSIR